MNGLRTDVMTQLRGCEPFDRLWAWLSSDEPTDFGQIEKLLRQEEEMERRADEAYWKPLKEELVQLRLNRDRQHKD